MRKLAISLASIALLGAAILVPAGSSSAAGPHAKLTLTAGAATPGERVVIKYSTPGAKAASVATLQLKSGSSWKTIRTLSVGQRRSAFVSPPAVGNYKLRIKVATKHRKPVYSATRSLAIAKPTTASPEAYFPDAGSFCALVTTAEASEIVGETLVVPTWWHGQADQSDSCFFGKDVNQSQYEVGYSIGLVSPYYADPTTFTPTNPDPSFCGGKKTPKTSFGEFSKACFTRGFSQIIVVEQSRVIFIQGVDKTDTIAMAHLLMSKLP